MKPMIFSAVAVALAGALASGAVYAQAVQTPALAPPPAPDLGATLPTIAGVVPGSVPPWTAAPEASTAKSEPGSAVPLKRVPAIEAGGAAGPPPPVNLLSDKDSSLTARERDAVAASRRWIDGPRNDGAGTGKNGVVTFRYGSAMPTVVCAPLFVCQVALQAGEQVNGIDVGDSVRWNISPSMSGAGAEQTVHVVIKPQDIGLTTNLLVTTDRRVYTIKLVSRRDDWMPSIAFSYPEDEAAAWAAVRKEQARNAAATVIPGTGQSLASLDFNYRLRGDKPTWHPLRVYNDGRQTTIQFPAAMASSEAPALVALSESKEQVQVNYRVLGDRYVVDRVLDRALLLTGVGRKQTAVRIERGN